MITYSTSRNKGSILLLTVVVTSVHPCRYARILLALRFSRGGNERGNNKVKKPAARAGLFVLPGIAELDRRLRALFMDPCPYARDSK